VTLRDSCEVRIESRFHFVVVALRDSCEVRTESRFHFVVLLSTLLHAILHPSDNLLNVLLQIANKLGLSKKKNIYAPIIAINTCSSLQKQQENSNIINMAS
jgi:hypothetical protein